MDCSLPGSSVYGICQARLLEWVAISFSRGSSWPRDKTYASCIGRGILYHSATREALMYLYISYIFMLERGKSFYSCMRHWCLVWYLGQSSYLGNCSWETLSVRFYASGRQISRLISSLKFLSYCVRGAVWCLLLLCVRHQYFFMFSKTLSASPSVRFIKFLVTVGTLGNTVSSHVNLQPLKGVRGSQMGLEFSWDIYHAYIEGSQTEANCVLCEYKRNSKFAWIFLTVLLLATAFILLLCWPFCLHWSLCECTGIIVATRVVGRIIETTPDLI